jgi:hypothetical protein
VFLAVFGLLYFQIRGKTLISMLLISLLLLYFYLLLAGLFMILRDIGYMIRFKIFTENKVTWWQAFRVIMLWEFASAISPSAIGGTGVAVVFVHKEGNQCRQKCSHRYGNFLFG